MTTTDIINIALGTTPIEQVVTENAQIIFATLEAMVSAESRCVANMMMRNDGIAITTEEISAATDASMEAYEKAVDLVKRIKSEAPRRNFDMTITEGTHSYASH